MSRSTSSRSRRRERDLFAVASAQRDGVTGRPTNPCRAAPANESGPDPGFGRQRFPRPSVAQPPHHADRIVVAVATKISRFSTPGRGQRALLAAVSHARDSLWHRVSRPARRLACSSSAAEVQIDCANTSVTSIRWDMRRVADDSVWQLHFGDDSGECEATAGLQHASANDQKNANPLQRHEFQG